MRNRIFYALAVVVSAALLSIAIAWGLKLGYLLVEQIPHHGGTFDRGGELFAYSAWEGLGQTSVTVEHLPPPMGSIVAAAIRDSSLDSSYTDFEVPATMVAEPDLGDCEIATGTYGLPFRCMRSFLVASKGTAPRFEREYEQLVITRSTRPFGRVFSVPLKPLWPGLLANTVFWAVAIVAAGVVSAQIRAITRRCRGNCPACGYDLRDELAKGCSECGWGKNDQDREGAVRHDSHV